MASMLLIRTLFVGLVFGVSIFSSLAWSYTEVVSKKVLLLGTYCLPPSIEFKSPSQEWKIINKTCAKHGGIDEQFRILELLATDEIPDSIIYFEGTKASIFLDYFQVSEKNMPKENPFKIIQELWSMYGDYIEDPIKLDRKFQELILEHSESYQSYCEQRGCKFHLMIPDAVHSSGSFFSKLSQTNPPLGTFYTFLTPNIYIDLRPITTAAQKNQLSISKFSLAQGSLSTASDEQIRQAAIQYFSEIILATLKDVQTN